MFESFLVIVFMALLQLVSDGWQKAKTMRIFHAAAALTTGLFGSKDKPV